MTDPLSPDEISVLAEYLEHSDPAALHVPNGTVVRLLAMLDSDRRRADESAELLNIAMEEWNREAAAAHRKSFDWQLKAGRFFHERNVAQARLELLRRQLGEEEMAELAAKLGAALADDQGELMILPPDCVAEQVEEPAG